MTDENRNEQGESDEAKAEEPAAEAEERTAETQDPAPGAEEPAAAPEEDAPAEKDAPAAEDSSEAKPVKEASKDEEGEGSKKKSEQPPGAELEPIRLEPERELSAEERARKEAEDEERARLEAAATAEEGEEPVAADGRKLELAGDARIQATGKRKSSIARVVLGPGKGQFEVNNRSIEEYFPRSYLQTVARQALVTSGYEGQVDVAVRVRGGGIAGQAGAVRHGVARALCEADPELRGELKRRGFLTRDARVKERRKAGLKKARKRPQFSKR